MYVIDADDVAPIRLCDVARLLAAPSLEAVAGIMLAAYKADGDMIGTAARDAVADVLAIQHPVAAPEIVSRLPDHLRRYASIEGLAAAGLHYISDRAGSFASITRTQAVVGSADELAEMLGTGIVRGLRRCAADAALPEATRYEAALEARTRLTVVN